MQSSGRGKPSAPPVTVEDETTRQLSRSTDVFVAQVPVRARDCAALTVLSGPDAGKVFSMNDVNVLGRSTDCSIRLDDANVSRVHAEIVRRASRWVILDRHSRNGTLVDGQRVDSHELRDGDRIELGPTAVFRFTISDKDEELVLRQLYESSVRDGLTGAFNRKHFDERLSGEMSFALRHSAPLSLLMIDIDHFKRINDLHGHLVGDEVLRSLVQCLQKTIRTEDILARYGGEEFAVIARGTDATGAIALAERTRTATSQLEFCPNSGDKVEISISVGIGVLDAGRHRSGLDLIKEADDGLYAAKRGGRNQVRLGRSSG